jgi:hypothetical protein
MISVVKKRLQMPNGASDSTSGGSVWVGGNSGQNNGSKWSPVVGSGWILGRSVPSSVVSATTSGIALILVISGDNLGQNSMVFTGLFILGKTLVDAKTNAKTLYGAHGQRDNRLSTLLKDPDTAPERCSCPASTVAYALL